jgi:hypothetical protein
MSAVQRLVLRREIKRMSDQTLRQAYKLRNNGNFLREWIEEVEKEYMKRGLTQ